MGCSSSKVVSPDAVQPKSEEILSQFESLRCLVPELRSINLTHHDLKAFLSTHPTLLRYIKEYLTHANAAISFLANLNVCLAAARQAAASLEEAVGHFHDRNYILCLAKMKDFTSASNPFVGLLDVLGDVESQRTAAETAVARRNKLDRRLSSLRVSRMVWKIAANAVLVLILTSAVVLAALGLPPVATTSAFAASTGLKTAEQWLDSVMNGRKEELEEERKVVQSIAGGWVVVHELDSLRTLMARVEIEFEWLTEVVNLVVAEEDGSATRDAVNRIREKVRRVEELINGLEVNVERCSMDIRASMSTFFRLCIDQLS
ncbi:hypothetical protein HPP92_006925 [Vanilla planifolia]|uniref:Uncharacterized protein n=1 Tax=Vanilla planifolia TaxID=51239 RepID=A0A835RFN9_VANPL|nr:hypothetical protein HPP92_006925 [Vanilla planifolia]